MHSQLRLLSEKWPYDETLSLITDMCLLEEKREKSLVKHTHPDRGLAISYLRKLTSKIVITITAGATRMSRPFA